MPKIKKISQLEHLGALSPDCSFLLEEKGQAKRLCAGALTASADCYDLKEGYGYKEDVSLGVSGEEIPMAGHYYKLVDYIPVTAGVSYTMYGVGFALYDGDKAFLSARMREDGVNQIREFTPEANGYVRLVINSPKLTFARFCLTSQKHLGPMDYEPAPSPFADYRIACDVHLYGDSNSAGVWNGQESVADASKSWANRLGALITKMPTTTRIDRFNCFAATMPEDDMYGGKFAFLGETGYASLTAYTNQFTFQTTRAGQIRVVIDGQEMEPVIADPTDTGGLSSTYKVEEGLHTLELFGVSGINEVTVMKTDKTRTFTNHAVYGQTTMNLPEVPEGNIVIVMYGTNDRMIPFGYSQNLFGRFYAACKKKGAIGYFFTPVPTAVIGESSQVYVQSISDVIAQLPHDCINIYKDLQLIQALTGESLYSDNVHLTQRGHKLLYAIAASKLQLAALTSEVMEE